MQNDALSSATHARYDSGPDGAGAIVDALRSNRHLKRLILGSNNMSKDFARLRLLLAVRANTGLRFLVACGQNDNEEAMPSAVEAEALVAGRCASARVDDDDD